MTDRFKLRKTLISQGVTTEVGMRAHEEFLRETLRVNPSFDTEKYRVNPINVNLPMMG